MELAVCYARVSTVEQAQHGVSLDAQVDRLVSYCTNMGLQVIRVIKEDPISATKPLITRPGGRKMLESLAEGEVRHVVAMKLDRLFRSTRDALDNVTRWDQNNVVMHLVDMGGTSLNTASAMGRMMLTLMASFAEFERNLISERTSAALAHKKMKLEAYNQTPYGFRKEGKRLARHESEQKVLSEVFGWRKGGMSLFSIADRLNNLRVPAKKGGKWHAETVRQILRNDIHRQAPDNMLAWTPPERTVQPAETKFMGDLAGAIRQWNDEPSKP